MPENNKTTNNFEEGMNNDLDPKLRSNKTFSYGVNCRLVYNDDGTLVLETNKGTGLSISNYGYEYTTIGIIEYTDFVIVFSKYKEQSTGSYDTIGYIKFNELTGDGVYRDLFNDSQEPQNQKLNFNIKNKIQGVGLIESDDLIRAYFTDDLNQPKVFTFCKKDANQSYWYLEGITQSVFTMNAVPNWKMGELHYQGLIAGNLYSGIYQYSYRLRTEDGYQTPWSPVTFPIINTGNRVKVTNIFAHNNEAYGMRNADEEGVNGNLLKIQGLDTRYKEIEVAYIHSITSAGAKEAGIFTKLNIDPSGIMYIPHTTIQNITPIPVESFIELKDVILTAKTIQIKDNRLWYGNTKVKSTFTIPDSVLENFYVEPEFRAIPIDYHSSRVATLDFKTVKSSVGNATFMKRKYRRYDVTYGPYAIDTFPTNIPSRNGISDATNYQGAQVCHSFTGYFRRETYRFAIQFFDLKGYPFFAKHIADVQMPGHIGTNGKNLMRINRVRENGTVQYREIDIGPLGGIPTETNDVWTGHSVTPNNGASGVDRRLAGSLSGTAVNIESYFKEPHNSTVNSSGRHNTTKLMWNNPNNINSAAERNPQTENYANIACARALGLRFGGIDLSVLIDGVPLYKLISGFSIVRAERTGVDEQVKDQGVLLNCARDTDGTGSDLEQRKKAWILPTPVTSPIRKDLIQGGYHKETKGFKYYDEGGGTTKPLSIMPNLYSFDGVNFKLTGQAPRFKKGITKLRQEFICDNSAVRNGDTRINAQTTESWGWGALSYYTGYDQPFDYENTKENPYWNLPRHYISKNLNTFNYNALTVNSESDTTDYTRLYRECGKNWQVLDLKTTPGLGNTRGFFNEYIVGTLLNLAYTEDDDYGQNSLMIFKKYDGGKNNETLKDNVWLKGVASPTIILQANYPYACARGAIKDDYSDMLSFYVASIVEENPQPYGGLKNEAIQNTRFHTTGHFVSVDDTMISLIKDGGYVVNETEVWGGDCYLDAMSYLRVYPYIEYNAESCYVEPQGKEAKKSESGERKFNFSTDEEFRDWSHGIIYPVESKYNFRLTYKDKGEGVSTWAHVGTTNGATEFGDYDKYYYRNFVKNRLHIKSVAACGPNITDNYQLNDCLNYRDRVRAYAPKPVDYIEVSKFPTRWHWSNEKINYNRVIDDFRNIEEPNNLDLSGAYGEIIGNAVLFDKIYSVQERAFGSLRINERAVVSTPNAGDLQLGEGGVMDGVTYISTQNGSQHRDSIVASDRNIYFVDARNSKIFRFGQDGLDPLSDSKGLHHDIDGFLTNIGGKDEIINGSGIVATVNNNNSDVIFTMRGLVNANLDEFRNRADYTEYVHPQNKGYLTLVYNESIAKFQGVHTYYPTFYFNYGKWFYSNGNGLSTGYGFGTGEFVMHNVGRRAQYFGQYYHTYLNFNVTPAPSTVFKFDVASWNVNKDALANIRKVELKTEDIVHVYEDLSSEIVGVSGYSPKNRAKYNQGLLRFPLREYDSKKPRLSGKTLEVSLWVENNANDLKFSLTSIDTFVRYHNKI